MAKKLLSILCALTLLASMVTIAVVTVSAAPDGYAEFKPLSQANVTFTEKETNKYYGLIKNTTYFGDYFYPFQTTGTAVFPTAYEIDNEFEFSFDFGYGYHASVPDEMHVEIELGKLLIVINSTGNNPFSQVVAKYDGTQIGETVVTGWGQYASPTDDEKAQLAQEINTALEIDTVKAGMAVGYVQEFKCAFDGTNLTVTMGKPGGSVKTITGTIANADFSNAVMKITSKEDGYRAAAIGNFAGTYKTIPAPSSVETSSEASSAAPAPIVLDKTFKSLSQATVTPDYGTESAYSYGFSGIFTDKATFGDGLVLDCGAPAEAIPQGIAINYGNYNMQAFQFGAVLGYGALTKTHTGKNYGQTVVMKVGDLALTLTFSAKAGYVYDIAASYKGNPLELKNPADAVITETGWGHSGKECFGLADLTAYHDAMLTNRGVDSTSISGDNLKGLWPKHTLPFAIGYENGVVTVYTGSGGNSTLKVAATATLTGADFSNANVSLTTKVTKGIWYIHNIGGKYMGTALATSSTGTSSTETSSTGTSSTVTSSTGTSSTVTSSTETSSTGTSSTGTSSNDTSSNDTSSNNTSSEPRKVVTTDMGGLGQATCEIPEDLNWNSAGSGLGKTQLTGDAMFIGAQTADVNLTANVGSYAVNSYFKLNFDLFAKNGSKASNGIEEGNENWIVKVGDFEFAFTRPTLGDKDANEHWMLQSVKYKGQALTITGETLYTPNLAVYHRHNSPETVAAAAEYKKNVEDNFGRLGWMFTSGLPNSANFWPIYHHSVEIVYDNGVITITAGMNNPGGNAPVVATVDATSVVDTTKALGNCAVTVNGHSTNKRGTHVSAFGNFKASYEKIEGAVDNGGSGNNGGSGSGNGSGNGGGAVGTGDTRNLVLPLAVMMACLAAGALVLLNRKQNA